MPSPHTHSFAPSRSRTEHAFGPKRSALFLTALVAAVIVLGGSMSSAQAQTNIYWDTSAGGGIGGSGIFSASGVSWATNPSGASVATGGPTGDALFIITNSANGVNAWASGNYALNFGGTAGTVTNGGGFQTWGINILTSGYVFTIDGTSNNSRTLTMTNSLDLGANSLTFANGARGTNSYTLAGQSNGWTGGITASNGSAGIVIANTNPSNLTNFGFYISHGGSVSANAPINILTLANTRVMLGSQSSGGANFNSAITNNSAGGSPLELTNSASGVVAFNGVISGSNGIALNNSSSGKITLNAANTYAGGTTVNGTGTGQIQFSNNSAFGSGTITIAGAGTNYIRASASNLDISNAVVINSGSTLRLAATNNGHSSTWSGAISGAGGLYYAFSDNGLYLTSSNSSFGGGVVNGSSGTLYITKLGNAGENSSLGTNGTVTFGIQPATSGAAALRWIGTVNDTSDKNFVMGATNAIAGMQILNNGSGTNLSLTLNGTISANNSSNKAITLGSYSNNNLILNGQMVENGGSLFSLVVGTSSSGTVTLNNTNNNISGGVTITNSTASTTTTLSVAKIGNAGETSPLGTNGTINVGISSSSGTASLSYSGAGETNNRIFNLTRELGTLQLDQSGTGNLKFTGAITSATNGSRTIKLQGSTAGTGELGSGIGDLGGVMSLNKSGSGTWTLSGNNTYSGSTTIGAGTLRLAGTNTLPTSGVLVGSSGNVNASTLELATGGDYVLNSFGSSNAAGGYMNFTNSSGSAATMTFSAATNYISLSSAASGGRAVLNNSTNLTVTFNGAVDIGGSVANDVTFGGAGNTTIKGAIFNTNTGVRGLTKTGTGALTLEGANTYNGATIISAGTLRLANSSAMGVTNGLTNKVESGAALELLGGITVDGEILALNGRGVSDDGALRNISGNNAYNGLIEINGTNRINSDAGTLTVSAFTNVLSDTKSLLVGGAGNTVISGALDGNGTGRLIKDGTGTLTISAANTVNGGITVGAGSLIVSSAGYMSNSSSTVIISNGASLRYNGTTALRAASVSLGDGGGAGRAVLGGTGTINSTVTLDSLDDVLSPGNSPGTQNFTPAQIWSSFTYDWELNNFPGTTAGTDFDQISIAAGLTLSGSSYGLNVLSLTALNAPGNVPNFAEVNTTWTILSASGGITGFNAGNWAIDASGFTTGTVYQGAFSLAQVGNDLQLTYTVPEPSTYALIGVSALACGAWFIRRRRKS